MAARSARDFQLVLISDVHLGMRYGRLYVDYEGESINMRELDFYRAAQAVAQWVDKIAKPDIVVIAGDLWEKPQPHSLALEQGFDFVDRLSGDGQRRVLIVGGNHDTPPGKPGTHSPLLLLRRLPGVEVCDDFTVIEEAGLTFICCPYRSLLYKAQEKAAEVLNTLPPNSAFLVAHGSLVDDLQTKAAPVDTESAGKGDLREAGQISSSDVQKSVSRPLITDAPVPYSLCSKESLIAALLGHIHTQTNPRPKVYYGGCLERRGWSDMRAQPGVWQLQLTACATGGAKIAKAKRVPLEAIAARLHITDPLPRPWIPITIKGSAEAVAQAIEELENQIEPGSVVGIFCEITQNKNGTPLTALEQRARYHATKAGAALVRVEARALYRKPGINNTGTQIFVDLTHNTGEASEEGAGEGEGRAADPQPRSLEESYREYALNAGYPERVVGLGVRLLEEQRSAE